MIQQLFFFSSSHSKKSNESKVINRFSDDIYMIINIHTFVNPIKLRQVQVYITFVSASSFVT